MEDCLKKKDHTHAQNFLLCYYPCINSMRELSLVPNENLMRTIKNFNDIDINDLTEKVVKEQESGVSSTPQENKTKSFLRREVDKEKLYVSNNFVRIGMISEDIIVRDANEAHVHRRLEYEVKVGDDGMKTKKIVPQINYIRGRNKNSCEVYPQTHILDMLTLEYNKFNVDLDPEILDAKKLLDASLNIFLFMRNSDEFKEISEIYEVLNCIFFIYYDKYIDLCNKNNNNNNKFEDKEK